MSTALTIAAETRDWRFSVAGMTCASCAGRIEKALRAVPGVLDASVNLATERAQVHAIDDVTPGQLESAVSAAGYTAKQLDTPPTADTTTNTVAAREPMPGETRHLLLAMALSLPLVLPMVGMIRTSPAVAMAMTGPIARSSTTWRTKERRAKPANSIEGQCAAAARSIIFATAAAWDTITTCDARQREVLHSRSA